MGELDRSDAFKLGLAFIGIVVALGVVASIVLALISIFVFLVPLFVYTSPAWLIGFGVSLLFIYLVQKDSLNRLTETTDLTLYSAVVRLDGDVLRYSYEENALLTYSKAGQNFFYATIICCSTTLAFTGLIVLAFDYFHNLRASLLLLPEYYIEVYPLGAFLLATIMSTVPIGLVVKFANPEKIFAQPLQNRLKEISPYKDFEVVGLSQLRGINDEVTKLSQEMELPLYSSPSTEHVDYVSPVKDYVKENQIPLLIRVDGLLGLVGSQINFASEYRSQLIRARERQRNLRQKYDDVSRRVAQIPSSKALRMNLEDLQDGIYYDKGYSDLLAGRKWNDWNALTSNYLDALDLLEGLLIKYETEDYTDENYYRQFEESGSLPEDQNSLNWAYDLLGVSPDSTLKEIEATFKRLARSLHPDTGNTTGEFKYLSEAKSAIKEERRKRNS